MNALVVIDMQYDFVSPYGTLSIPGAAEDCKRLTKWIQRYGNHIDKIFISLDTHYPQQIFFPSWWQDGQGLFPEPFTTITLEDVDEGKYAARYEEVQSRMYLESLERLGRKQLVIWPYHCLLGTVGHTLEETLYHTIMIEGIRHKEPPRFIIKGELKTTEYYSIFEPETHSVDHFNLDLMNELDTYDKIYVAGEAKSHCVLESLDSIAGFRETLRKVILLEDTTSSVVFPGVDFETPTKRQIQRYTNMGMKIATTLEGP